MILRQHNEGVPRAELTETTSRPPTKYQACKRSHNQQTIYALKMYKNFDHIQTTFRPYLYKNLRKARKLNCTIK